jgi:hypothetical protein
MQKHYGFHVSTINNKLGKATYSVSNEEFNFIKAISSWISLIPSTSVKKDSVKAS